MAAMRTKISAKKKIMCEAFLVKRQGFHMINTWKGVTSSIKSLNLEKKAVKSQENFRERAAPHPQQSEICQLHEN